MVIDHFGVEFITTLRARGHGGGSTANIDAKLEGVSDEAMQALTDRAYQDTVSALTQAGFEVVPADELQGQALYRELMAKVGHDAPYVVDDTGAYSRIFAPAGMKAVFKSGAENRGSIGDRMDAFNSKYQGEFSDVAKSLACTWCASTTSPASAAPRPRRVSCPASPARPALPSRPGRR